MARKFTQKTALMPMGSSTKRNPKAQAETAELDGTDGIGPSEDEPIEKAEDEITVHLVNIDISVLDRTNVGDRASRNGPEVSVRGGVLGYVSQADLDKLEGSELTKGTVSSRTDGTDGDDASVAVTFTM